VAVVSDVAEIVICLALNAGCFVVRAMSHASAPGPWHRARNWALDAEFVHSVMMVMMVMMVMHHGVRDARGRQHESRRRSDSRSNQTHVSSP
jgi:hypothetical protein